MKMYWSSKQNDAPKLDRIINVDFITTQVGSTHRKQLKIHKHMSSSLETQNTFQLHNEITIKHHKRLLNHPWQEVVQAALEHQHCH